VTRTLRLDDAIELFYPHTRLPRDLLSRTDTHQCITYIQTHYDPCAICVSQDDCPPCQYNERKKEEPL